MAWPGPVTLLYELGLAELGPLGDWRYTKKCPDWFKDLSYRLGLSDVPNLHRLLRECWAQQRVTPEAEAWIALKTLGRGARGL